MILPTLRHIPCLNEEDIVKKSEVERECMKTLEGVLLRQDNMSILDSSSSLGTAFIRAETSRNTHNPFPLPSNRHLFQAHAERMMIRLMMG